MKKTVFFLILFLNVLIPSLTAQNADPLNAVVKISMVISRPSYSIPWQNRPQQRGSGSGAVIPGGLILTNAHNVADATFIAVSRQNDTTPFPARVAAVDHQADLALLVPEDKSFFNGITPLEIGETPPVRSQVYAAGYPMGGEGLSVTKGIISRIEPVQYAHSIVNNLLAAQLDAAINPGNSGGPVLYNGKIAGIAFQGAKRGKSLGYMIHTDIIRHFLTDFKDGKIDGFQDAPLEYQELNNADARKALHLPEGKSGMLVTRVHPFVRSVPSIRPGDVIVAVDGKIIDNNGRFRDEKGIPYHFGVLIDRRQAGETIPMTVFRDGKEFTSTLSLNRVNHLKIQHPEFDVQPEYFICGGAVFMPLTMNLLGEIGSSLPASLQEVLTEEKKYPEDQTVVLTIVLGDEINTGYQDLFCEVVSKVNGKEIRNLKELAAAAETVGEGFLHIELRSGKHLYFDAGKLKSANERILHRNGIHADRRIR